MKKYLSLISSLLITIAVIIAAVNLGNAWKRTHKGNETISVTGSAKRDFTSDLIVWRGSVSKKAPTLLLAYSSIKNDNKIIKDYLLKKGVKNSEIVFEAVNIGRDYKTSFRQDGTSINEPDGYILSQNFMVSSKEVEKIGEISRNISELIDMGVELNSQNPEYYYTKLAELKIQLIAEATKDAKMRAAQIAENAGAKLGYLRKATMGIFQITGQNSNEDFSYGGAFNTWSKEKSATITMRLEYAIR
ncbi:MAG: SIMPL domain-containing protein [Lentimicrobiaceae bacterium]|nr:SIMPL domain-containing protein [Lentimicrobiaceae bacterium]